MNLRSLYLLTLLALPGFSPACAQDYKPLTWIANNKPKAAVIATSLGIGAFLINKWARKSQNGLHMPKDALIKRIYAGPANLVAKLVDNRKLRAYRDRQALLPAILRCPANSTLPAYIGEAFDHCAAAHQDYLAKITHEERIALEKKGPIAVHVYITSPWRNPQHQSFHCYQDQSAHPERLFIKNITDPKVFLHRELRVGECAIIGFSDGSTQIHINKTDSDSLVDLNEEQHAFIVSLSADAGGPNFTLTKKEQETFDSLNRRLQTNLASNYGFTPAPEKNYQPLKDAVGFGAFLINCACLAQKWKSASKINFGINAVAFLASSAGTLACLNGYENDRKEAWKGPIIHCAIAQAFEHGPKILNWISGNPNK